MEAAKVDVNLGLFDGEVSHDRINTAVAEGDKSILFGEQTRLPYFSVDELLPTLYCRRADAPGLARDDLDALYADAPRLAALAVRPSLVWERRGLSDTEASGEVNCK